jgi:hypothetical protein
MFIGELRRINVSVCYSGDTWLRHYTSNQKVTGSIPDEVTGFFSLLCVQASSRGKGRQERELPLYSGILSSRSCLSDAYDGISIILGTDASICAAVVVARCNGR